METSCQLPSDNVAIHPIGFRTHTHNLGMVVSGYKVSNSKNDWSLIGKMNPHRPQTFYPVADPDMVIRGGEYLAARCTMVWNFFYTSWWRTKFVYYKLHKKACLGLRNVNFLSWTLLTKKVQIYISILLKLYFIALFKTKWG